MASNSATIYGEQEGTRSQPEPEITCPFCKANPKVWLHHDKCGPGGRKPLKKLKELLRWHIIKTHERHNLTTKEGDPDHIDPRIFERLNAWNGKRKDWSDPLSVWREVYALIVDVQSHDVSAIPDPYWTEDWVRSSYNSGVIDPNAIERAIVDSEVVRDESKKLLDLKNSIEKVKEETVARFRSMSEESIASLSELTSRLAHEIRKMHEEQISALESIFEGETNRLKDELRGKFLHACDQNKVVGQVGSFGEEGVDTRNDEQLQHNDDENTDHSVLRTAGFEQRAYVTQRHVQHLQPYSGYVQGEMYNNGFAFADGERYEMNPAVYLDSSMSHPTPMDAAMFILSDTMDYENDVSNAQPPNFLFTNADNIPNYISRQPDAAHPSTEPGYPPNYENLSNSYGTQQGTCYSSGTEGTELGSFSGPLNPSDGVSSRSSGICPPDHPFDKI